MLQSLHIQNYALIDNLDIEFENGFSVITGETGAGKSILLGAIGLLLGQRADLRMIKTGAQRCVIEAIFNLSQYDFQEYFQTHELDFDGSECIIRRELTASGKSRAFINDTPTSLADLKELGEQLIDIHSQHQNLLLKGEDFQLRVLDALAQNPETRAEYATKYAEFQAARKELDEARQQLAQGKEDEDYIAFQLNQLQEAKLSEEEEEELENELTLLEHAEEIKSALYESSTLLEGDEQGIVSQMREALRKLNSIVQVYPTAQELADRLDSCYIEARDIANEIADNAEQVDYDPKRLSFINDRISTIESLKQKFHKENVGELIQLRDSLAKQLSLVQNSDEHVRKLEEELKRKETELTELAGELTKQRTKSAHKLEKEMENRLSPLGMPNVRFQVQMEKFPDNHSASFSRTGCDKVAFLFSANKNIPMQPISQVASGGEISRVMLSLKALISGVEKLPTIIFDEIDTGVSGHIAEKMADMMKEMGDDCNRQVISITHLPQIAAKGTHHYRVFKSDEGDTTTSNITRLTNEERINELARMLSGSTLTQAAIDNARALLRFLIILLLSCPAFAGNTPKWLKQAGKSIVELYSIRQTGDTIRANAFFTDENGNIAAPYSAIKDARKAWVVDVKGKSHDVKRILGFNSTYDIVSLSTLPDKKKNVSMPISGTKSIVGTTCYLMPNGEGDEICQVEKAGEYEYYTLKTKADTELAGMPLLNETGELIGIVQTPLLTDESPCYALDINFMRSLSIRPIDANHPDLRNCSIAKQLPSDEASATSFLYIAGTSSNEMRLTYTDDFINAFPKSVTGYIQKAELLVSMNEWEAAENVYQEGLGQKTGHDDELLYSRSQMAYKSALQHKTQSEAKMDTSYLEHSLADIQSAQAINPQPLYLLHEANVLYAQKQYSQAYNRYMAVTQTKMRSAEVFLYAWQCQQKLAADGETLLALNDSAVACFTKPYQTEAAPYLLLRSNTLADLGKLRDAIADMNDYEHLMQGRLTAQFYYQREQLEVRTRMFGPAMNDIQQALSLAPNEPLFHAESAVLFFRLNDVDNAIEACQKAISIDENFPDAYRLLGICYREKGEKAEARKQLSKAIELGDELAPKILQELDNK